MNKDIQQQNFLNAINNRLERRVEEIDDATKGALREIRKSVIAQTTESTSRRWQWLQPIPIMAAASIVLVVSVSLHLAMNTSSQTSPDIEDIALLSAAEDIDFYADLEFYQWLDAEKFNG